MSLIRFALFQSLLYTLAYAQGSCQATSNVELTFYGWPDGQSDQIAFSCGSNGGHAGGSGTYSDPETFATAISNTNFKNCDIVYIPYFQKYFQYSDHCNQCDTDYHSGKTHLDLWIGKSQDGALKCEQTFGALHDQTIIQNPPSTLPVNSGALWDGSTCHDASSPDPFVFPNPSTNGLCSGGSSPGGGSSSTGESTTASPPSSSAPTFTTPPPTNQPPTSALPAPTSTSDIQPPVLPSSQSPPSQAFTPGSITPSVAPTTFLTSVLTTSSSSSVTPTTSTSSGGTKNTSNCASWGGCLGDPCNTYNDCAGEWICMGAPKTCHDNRID